MASPSVSVNYEPDETITVWSRSYSGHGTDPTQGWFSVRLGDLEISIHKVPNGKREQLVKAFVEILGAVEV